VGAGWLTSYYRNLGYVETVSQAAKQAQVSLEGLAPGEQDFSRILPALNTVRDLPGGYGEQDASVPILSRLGLYQGDKLGSQARAAYFRALGDAFLPAIMLRMEDQLRRGQTNLEFLYETLKAYLMLGDRAHYDPETVKAWVLLNWQQSLPRQFTNEQREALEGHLGAMLAHLPDPLPLPLDTDLIARTRAAVARVPLATRVYGRLKLGQYGRLAPEFRVADAAGRDAAVTFVRKSGEPLTRGVPGLYTLAGYRQVFQKQTPLVAADLLRETWVVGGEQASELTPERLTQLATEVRELYFKDYVAQWQGLLTDLDLVGLTSARQAVEVLGVLSGKDSPLKRLLVAVATQTTLGEEPQAEAAAQQAAGDALSAVKDRLARFLQTQPTAPGKPSEPPPASLVDERFADLHRLVRSEGGSPAPIDAVLAALDELFVQLNAFAGALDRGAKALDAASGGGGPGAAIGKLKLQAKRQPPPVNGWLEAVASNSASLTLGDARGHVRDAWAAEVLPFCRRATASRYPFVRGTTQDVTLDDFARLFGPGGLLDAFFQKYLSPFVETAASTWQWRPVGDSSLGSSPQVLREFQRAAEIKEAFFGAGATPSVKFQLRPISMDSSIERFALDLDGQQVSYSHGPARPTALVWPGPGGAGQVTIEMSPPAATGRSAQTLIGPWAWFRLLDDASIEPTSQPEEFRVTFDLGGRKAVYALTASSVQNPFRLPALRAFRCPEKL
jgi:type VI secretion system protein ImpL